MLFVFLLIKTFVVLQKNPNDEFMGIGIFLLSFGINLFKNVFEFFDMAFFAPLDPDFIN